jgi:hypothetical protein
MLPCIHDIIPQGVSKREWNRVVKAFRLLGEIRSIIGIDVITDDQIQHGKTLVEEFGKLIPVDLLQSLCNAVTHLSTENLRHSQQRLQLPEAAHAALPCLQTYRAQRSIKKLQRNHRRARSRIS